MSRHPSNPLWAITSYYNPAGSARRLENYKTFRRQLNAPLLTIELARPQGHQLDSADAEKLVQLNGEEFLWQKERLLNLALAELPPHVRHIAWIDCDIVFENENWAVEAQAELDRHGGLLHLFSRAVHLPKMIPPFSTAGDLAAIPPLIVEPSMGYAASNGHGVEALHACYHPASRRKHGNTCATGMALAAPRGVLETCGLYDAAIVGGGDAILLCAALNQLDYDLIKGQANPQEFRHITQWAQKARQAGLFNRFRHLEQTAWHLWHGELGDRKYGKRHQITSSLNFDPHTDIRPAANGPWEWAAPDSGLARSVRDYFLSRRED